MSKFGTPKKKQLLTRNLVTVCFGKQFWQRSTGNEAFKLADLDCGTNHNQKPMKEDL